jgi:hypothetical protein
MSFAPESMFWDENKLLRKIIIVTTFGRQFEI